MKMIWLMLASLMYILLLIIVYFAKKRLSSLENNMFLILMFFNALGLVLELSCVFSVTRMHQFPIFNTIVTRGLLVYYLIWISIFTLYVFSVSYDKKAKGIEYFNKFMKKAFGCLVIYFLIGTFLVLTQPMSYYFDGISIYSHGPAVNVLNIFFVILIIVWVITLAINYKNIKTKKHLPIFMFIVLGSVIGIIQKMYPQLLLMTSFQTIIVFLMYFTIENPDIKILNELYKNKEIMEQNYEDKYNFLFEITQEARNPLVKINSICDDLKKEKNADTIKHNLEVLGNLVKQLDFSINDVLNISTLDVQKLNFIKNEYNLNQICNDLVVKVKANLKKDIDFRYNFPKDTPTLYGDYLKIKQILYSLLNNSIKHTENGFVEFNVSLIERYDVCRIIFNISDSGAGMPINMVNDILSATGEFDPKEIENLEASEYNIKVCQKIIKIMDGSLMIKSDIGKGTEIRLIIDQPIGHSEEKGFLNIYENVVNNYKKVLIISQDKYLTDAIKQRCQKKDMTLFCLLYGKDAIDRIKAGKKYDYILISDEMKEISGLMTLKELKQIKGFNIPCIVMLKKDKENIKDHYLSDGFDDYLLIDNFEKELEKIFNKY